MAFRGRNSQNVFCDCIRKKPVLLACREGAQELASWVSRAGDGTRTRDSLLGRQGVPKSPLACHKVALEAVLEVHPRFAHG